MEGQNSSISRREMLALAGTTALAGCSIGSPFTERAVQQPPRDTTQQDTTPAAGTQEGETVRAFVGAYHWGFFFLSELGEEIETLTLSSGDELHLTLFSVEAEVAMEALPGAVRNNIPSAAERARRNRRAIPVPQGTSLDSLHDAAEAAYPDHSLVILSDEFMMNRPGGPGRGPGSGGPSGPWGGHHGPHPGPYDPDRGQEQGQYPGSGGPYDPGDDQGSGGSYGSGFMPGHGWGSGSGGTLAPPIYLWHHATVPSELGFVVNTTGSFGFACTVYCGYGHPYMAERSRIVVSEN